MKKQASISDYFKKKSIPSDSEATTYGSASSSSNTPAPIRKKPSSLFEKLQKRFSTPTTFHQSQASSSRDVGPSLEEFDEQDTQLAIEASLIPNTNQSSFKRLSKKQSGIFTGLITRPLSDQSYGQSLPTSKKSKGKGKEPLNELSSEQDAFLIENYDVSYDVYDIPSQIIFFT
jgi:hypothetical protein